MGTNRYLKTIFYLLKVNLQNLDFKNLAENICVVLPSSESEFEAD